MIFSTYYFSRVDKSELTEYIFFVTYFAYINIALNRESIDNSGDVQLQRLLFNEL